MTFEQVVPRHREGATPEGYKLGADVWILSPGIRKRSLWANCLLAHLGDGVCNRGLPSSSGTINPHNKCLKILFPLNPLHDLCKNSQACVRVTFWGIETFIWVVECSGSCCVVKDVQAIYRLKNFVSFTRKFFQRGIAPQKQWYCPSLLTWVIVPPVIRVLDAKMELMLFQLSAVSCQTLILLHQRWVLVVGGNQGATKEQPTGIVVHSTASH